MKWSGAAAVVQGLSHLSVILVKKKKSQHWGSMFITSAPPPLSIVVCHLMYLCCLNNVNTKDCNMYTAFQVLLVHRGLFCSRMPTNFFRWEKHWAVFCSDVTDFRPVCRQRQAGISVFACLRVCAVMFGYLSTSLSEYGRHAVMPTLKQKRVLVSLSVHHEQGIHQLVARRLKKEDKIRSHLCFSS